MKTWQVTLGTVVGSVVGLTVGYLVGLAYASGTVRVYRDQLEVIYFIAAGPLVLLVLIAGLAQIVISVREISNRSQREAATLAIATCEKFAREFVVIEPKAVQKLTELNLPFTDWKLLDESLQWQAVANEQEARAWALAIEHSPEVFLHATDVVNFLEAVAMSFVYGKANDDVGYQTIGAPFCQCVRRWSPHLISLRSQQSSAASGKFAATVAIYRKWESRRRNSAP